MAVLGDIEGIGDAHAKKLKAAGVRGVGGLLKAGATDKGRDALATTSGLGGAKILTWVNHADLFRIKGVAGQYAELLEAAGVDSVPELAQRSPANLAAKMADVNAKKKLVRQVPSAAHVEGWVKQAKKLPRVVKH